jgi:hypothetical protein
MLQLSPFEIVLGAVVLAVIVMTVRACVRKQQCSEQEDVSLDKVDETRPSTSSPEAS